MAGAKRSSQPHRDFRVRPALSQVSLLAPPPEPGLHAAQEETYGFPKCTCWVSGGGDLSLDHLGYLRGSSSQVLLCHWEGFACAEGQDRPQTSSAGRVPNHRDRWPCPYSLHPGAFSALGQSAGYWTVALLSGKSSGQGLHPQVLRSGPALAPPSPAPEKPSDREGDGGKE